MLAIDFPNAASTINDKYYREIVSEERFEFPSTAEDFISTGVADHDEFISEVDGDPVVRTYNNFTINEGHLVRPTNRCKGLYLNILGDAHIHGTLSMTARGAFAPGKYVGIDLKNKVIHYNHSDTYPEDAMFVMTPIGGPRLTTYNTRGSDGVGNSCGGGGCGAVEYHYGGVGGYGGEGTSFSGGAGGGGTARGTAGSGGINAGRGGNGYGFVATTGVWFSAGGGAGNPGGPGSYGGHTGESGAGGVIIVFVHGDLVIHPTGKIVSAGSKGGDGYDPGGGSGGGAIHIFYKGLFEGSDKLFVPGGGGGRPIPAGGYSGAIGAPGGTGSISHQRIPSIW
jgi:hypothetical protein